MGDDDPVNSDRGYKRPHAHLDRRRHDTRTLYQESVCDLLHNAVNLWPDPRAGRRDHATRHLSTARGKAAE